MDRVNQFLADTTANEMLTVSVDAIIMPSATRAQASNPILRLLCGFVSDPAGTCSTHT